MRAISPDFTIQSISEARFGRRGNASWGGKDARKVTFCSLDIAATGNNHAAIRRGLEQRSGTTGRGAKPATLAIEV